MIQKPRTRGQSLSSRQRWLALCCVSAVVAFGVEESSSAEVVTLPSEPPGVPSDPNTLGAAPPVVPQEAEAYAEEFGISKTEAARRLEVQVKALALDAALRQRIETAYAGLYYDNTAGKLFISGTTDAALAEAKTTAAELGVPTSALEIRKVDASLPALAAAQATAERALWPISPTPSLAPGSMSARTRSWSKHPLAPQMRPRRGSIPSLKHRM